MKLSSLLLQVSGHKEVNPYVCSSLEQILPISPLHSTAATQQHFTCQTTSNRQNTESDEMIQTTYISIYTHSTREFLCLLKKKQIHFTFKSAFLQLWFISEQLVLFKVFHEEYASETKAT